MIRGTETSRLDIVLTTKGDAVTCFTQRKGEGCVLSVDDGLRAATYRGHNFDELAILRAEPVQKHLLDPLAHLFGPMPMTAASPQVLTLVAAFRPPQGDTLASLEVLLSRLDDDSAEEREEATKELLDHAASSAQVYCYLGIEATRVGSEEVRGRLSSILGAAPQRLKAFRFVQENELYRNLDFLTRHLSTGAPVREHLQALTGQRLDTAEEWSAWVRESRKTLRWDIQAWRYVKQ